MVVNTKKLSIGFMISVTVFLTFMDIKDLYYKITMCGPNQSWAFTADIHEEITDIDLTQFLSDNNGTRTTPHNQWNTLAQQCDSLVLYKLIGKIAHLSALGTGCTIGGVKRSEPLVFISSIRIDSMVWGAMLLADTIHAPFPVRPDMAAEYARVHNMPELTYRAALSTMVDFADYDGLNRTTRQVYDAFGMQFDLWEDTLCFEIVPLPESGTDLDHVTPNEYGCIWSNATGGNLHVAYVDRKQAKYFRALSEWVGWNWITLDYLHVNNIYLRARLLGVSVYTITNNDTDGKTISHWIDLDLGIDGVLYYAMLLVEIAMIVINSTDTWVVALLVVRPLILALKQRSYSAMSAVGDNRTSSMNDSSAHNFEENASETKAKKDETLSRMLLYTDLTCVAFRKPVLAILMVIDAFFSWLYIIPNSTVYAWSTSTYQLASAYMSNFRVWTITLVIIDFAWRWTFVLANERLAALITELTYISSFEIMIVTLFSVFHSYTDLLNVCLMKWGATDRQREMFLTAPGLLSFYNSFNQHTYGDRSNEAAGSKVLFIPLLDIVGWAIFFSFLVIVARLIVNMSVKAYRGTLRKEVETFWRTYQRNSVEVFMNDPLRAKALIRSQSMMSYRFGRSVFIRPFVYLEQNYYIYRGRFRRRPLVPLIDMSDVMNGAEVNIKAYQLEGVYHDEQTKKIKKKRLQQDTQIPLC